jgi:hypothetical protein
MFIPTLNPEIATSGPVYRAARLALLRHELVLSFKDTDAAARKVENALAKLSKANAADGTARQTGTISPAMCLMVMSTTEPHRLLTPELAAQQRIKRAELALARSEEMLAENIARRSRMRRLVEAADRLKIDRPSNEERRAG